MKIKTDLKTILITLGIIGALGYGLYVTTGTKEAIEQNSDWKVPAWCGFLPFGIAIPA